MPEYHFLGIDLSWLPLLKPNDFTRFENLTMSELYHPRIIVACHCFGAVITVANSIIYPIMIYVILTKSRKQMGNYKSLLAFQLTNGYIFNLITYLWHPVFFWPLTLGVPLGYFPHSTPVSYFLLFLEIGSLLLMFCIQAFLIAYRILAMFQDSFIHAIYRNSKLFYSIFFIAITGSFSLASSKILISMSDACVRIQTELFLNSEPIP